MQDLKLALRTLRKTPFTSGVAIVSLALGIGANAAIFSLFHQMLLQPLPVPESERLVNLLSPGPKPGSQSTNNAGPMDAVFSYPMFKDLESDASLPVKIAAHRSFGANLAWRGQTSSSRGQFVSGNYFPVLQLQPALGRLLGPDDDRTAGAHDVVVLAHAYWKERFGASSTAIIGEALVVNGRSLTVVGVAPEGFTGTTLGAPADVFVPLTMREALTPGWKGFENRRSYWAYLFARLNPGVSQEQAQAALHARYSAIIQDVETPLQEGMSPQTLERFKAKELVLEPGARGQSSIATGSRAPLTLLLGVTALVLLIACANIANLLLARGAGRAAEMAVRAAIGAARRHLFGQLLVEACVLASLGGLLGLLVAQWTLRGLHALMPAEAAATMRPELGPAVLAFTAAVALGTGLVFGLFPALHASRPDLIAGLRGQAGQPGGSRAAARFRRTLATAQVALSLALLVSAGLFTRSLANAARVDLGLQPEQLLTFAVSPELNGYTPEQSKALFERIEDEVGAIPGVSAVSASMVPLIAGSNWGSSVSVEGFESGPDTDAHSQWNLVGPGLFQTLGVPLLQGRDFTRQDALGAPKVAIVNQAFARKFGLGENPIGKRMGTGIGDATPLDIEIVGLIRDAKYSDVKQAPPPQFALPYRQDEGVGQLVFYVRGALSPEALVAQVPPVLKRLDPNLPVEELRTMPAQIHERLFLDRFISVLATAFAVLATALAALGLYGVLAYTVEQRTREFGVRMALGADSARVRDLVLGQVGRMTLVGALIGLPAAIGLGRVARSLLFEVESHDPVVLAAALVALACVAFAAGALPARRAARVEPMRALRYE